MYILVNRPRGARLSTANVWELNGYLTQIRYRVLRDSENLSFTQNSESWAKHSELTRDQYVSAFVDRWPAEFNPCGSSMQEFNPYGISMQEFNPLGSSMREFNPLGKPLKKCSVKFGIFHKRGGGITGRSKSFGVLFCAPNFFGNFGRNWEGVAQIQKCLGTSFPNCW